ncbi:glycosyltransferase family 4 protein [Candidatus Sumerlaeota bacterium]|nr:glycosyltransferase family 4 protein [Candidatus Sumerlaeota bacterium]
MRILVINYEFPPLGGGGGEVSKYLSEGYARRGHDVKILTARWGSLSARETLQERLFIRRIFAFRKQPDNCTPIRMAAFMFMALPEAFKIARQWKPDIVHCHFMVPVTPVGFFLKILFHIPFIVTLHGGDVPGHQPAQTAKYFRFIKGFLGMILKRADGVVSVSEPLRRLAGKSFPDIPIILIPNGVDVDLYHPLETLEREEEIKFIFSGRFNREKRLDILLEAIKHLILIGRKGFKVCLAGAGPLEKDLLNKARDWNLLETVRFTGWLAREKVAEELRKSHVFILPSEKEGMPVACLQAMASGLPVIGTRIPGIMQIINNRENGILVDAGNHASLSQAMEYMLDHRDIAALWGKRNREIAYCDFRLDVIINQYLDLFKKILKNRNVK